MVMAMTVECSRKRIEEKMEKRERGGEDGVGGRILGLMAFGVDLVEKTMVRWLQVESIIEIGTALDEKHILRCCEKRKRKGARDARLLEEPAATNGPATSCSTIAPSGRKTFIGTLRTIQLLSAFALPPAELVEPGSVDPGREMGG